MNKHLFTSVLVLGTSSVLLVHESRGQVFRIDMDYTTLAIDTAIGPPAFNMGDPVTVGIYLDLTGGGAGFPAGMSVYGVSIAFDNTELNLSPLPPPPLAGTQSIPTLLPFGFGTLGSLTETESDLSYDVSGNWGTVKSFAGFTLAAGPVGGLHLLGTINFKVVGTIDDGMLDVIPGFFNVGIDGLYDNASLPIVMGPANFVGGSVVPEPSVGLLAGGVVLLCSARRLFRRRADD